MAGITLAELIDAGFRLSAKLHKNDAGDPVLSSGTPLESGIYLFVVENRIRYVGSAAKSLSRRMNSYARRQKLAAHQKQALSTRPVHVELAKVLAGNHDVEIYTCAIAAGERIVWNRLPVSVRLGLEAALIIDIDPPWNRVGRSLPLDSDDDDLED